jgi:hypothetical protein
MISAINYTYGADDEDRRRKNWITVKINT